MKKLVLSFLLVSPVAFAESFVDIEEPISISGEYTQKDARAQRIKNLRHKMERQTEALVKKQLQNIRLKKELELQKKIQKMFQDQVARINQIQ